MLIFKRETPDSGPFKAQGLMKETNRQEYREESHGVGGGPVLSNSWPME